MNTPEITPQDIAKIRAYMLEHRGVSAATIVSVLVPELRDLCEGIAGGIGSYPFDSGDFGRCRRVLALIPGGVERLDEVAQECPAAEWEWQRLATAWPELDRIWLEGEEKQSHGGGMRLSHAIRRVLRGGI